MSLRRMKIKWRCRRATWRVPHTRNSSPVPSSASFESCQDDQTNDCPICLQTISHEVVTPCQHKFCKRCLRTWTMDQNTCPICRTVIPWMRNFKERLATFDGWRGNQDKIEMADNGFFSISDVCDIVQCVYCKEVFFEWDSIDNPWAVHAAAKPFCPRVVFRNVFDSANRY